MNGFQTQELSEVVIVTDFVANGSFEALRNNVITSATPNFAIVVRLVDYNRGWSGPFSYVDESSYHFLKKSSLQNGDVIISNVGANAGTVFRVPELSRPATLGPNSVLCRPRNNNQLNREFLYYYLTSPEGQSLIAGIISGSAQPKFNKTALRRLPVRLPLIAEQRSIANVLGALDDKIAANTKAARQSTELARAKFQQMMKTAINQTTLREVLRLEYGKSLAAPRRVMGDVDVFGSGGIVGTHNKPLLLGPGVIVGRKGTAGAVHWAPRAYFPIDTTYYVVPVIPEASLVFCLHLLESLRLNEMNSDSAVPGLNREEALATRVRMPDEPSLLQFTASAERLLSLVDQVDRESRALIKIRDAILPKLISGQLRVKDAAQIVSAAV